MGSVHNVYSKVQRSCKSSFPWFLILVWQQWQVHCKGGYVVFTAIYNLTERWGNWLILFNKLQETLDKFLNSAIIIGIRNVLQIINSTTSQLTSILTHHQSTFIVREAEINVCDAKFFLPIKFSSLDKLKLGGRSRPKIYCTSYSSWFVVFILPLHFPDCVTVCQLTKCQINERRITERRNHWKQSLNGEN